LNRKATNRDSSECATRRKTHSERIDLGIALLHDVAIPGVRYSQREIAWWAGCSDMLISRIERKALVKLSRRFTVNPEERRAFFACSGHCTGLWPDTLAGIL